MVEIQSAGMYLKCVLSLWSPCTINQKLQDISCTTETVTIPVIDWYIYGNSEMLLNCTVPCWFRNDFKHTGIWVTFSKRWECGIKLIASVFKNFICGVFSCLEKECIIFSTNVCPQFVAQDEEGITEFGQTAVKQILTTYGNSPCKVYYLYEALDSVPNLYRNHSFPSNTARRRGQQGCTIFQRNGIHFYIFSFLFLLSLLFNYLQTFTSRFGLLSFRTLREQAQAAVDYIHSNGIKPFTDHHCPN